MDHFGYRQPGEPDRGDVRPAPVGLHDNGPPGAGGMLPMGTPPPLTDFANPKRRPIREWETIRFDCLPTVRTKRQWLLGAKTHILLASGWKNDRALSLWIDEAVDVRRGWDDLVWSGHEELITLDYKLAEALLRYFGPDNKSDSAQRLNIQRNEQMDRLNAVARGRQILNHIFQDLHSELYYSDASNVLTLTKVKLHGNNLSEFSNIWLTVLQ